MISKELFMVNCYFVLADKLNLYEIHFLVEVFVIIKIKEFTIMNKRRK